MTEADTDDPQQTGSGPSISRLWLVSGLALGLLVCVVAGMCALRKKAAAADPEPLKHKVESMVKDLIRDHWNDMRKAVTQLKTDDGARAFFAENPGLATRVPTESTFVEMSRSWRPLLEPLPEALPSIEGHNLTYVKNAEGAEMSYRTPKGTRIFMKWAENKLVEMRVY
jgi:hypothetical protein